jgi:hypothetical protein
VSRFFQRFSQKLILALKNQVPTDVDDYGIVSS